jgi:hypothetical protein
MAPRPDITTLSPSALRMRRSRERRRQGDVMVTLKIGPNVTADLAALGWLPTTHRLDKETIARALAGLIDQAITTLVTSSTVIKGARVAPLRVTPMPIASVLAESAVLPPKLTESFERGDSRNLGLGRVQPSEVLNEADGVADIVEDNYPEARLRDQVDNQEVASEHAQLPRLELVWGFSCQAVVFGLLSVLCSEREAVLRPVACDQVRGARGRGQGTETVAELCGLPTSGACVSQRLDV